ncbi:ANTAR domain-containing protein [Amycolatopsis sp. NPDC098790]|uniref:ANTAR domain-containing protein n=1 Tax=Amycolatopsis sp. NPDC098790 TaxID=3363939 RepID=UPI00381BC1AD
MTENEQLREALATQPVIEQAKGMLMLLRSWTADQAFEALVVVSQHTNVKLHDVAKIVVSAGSRAGHGIGDLEVERAVLVALRTHVGSASVW